MGITDNENAEIKEKEEVQEEDKAYSVGHEHLIMKYFATSIIKYT